MLGTGRQERRIAGRLPVGPQERGRCPLLPECRPRLQRSYSSGRRAVNDKQAGKGRVAERAQHAGHVLQRGLLHAPLRQRPRRLAFEIEDHEIVLHPQHLAQVIVAVNADAHDAADRSVPARGSARECGRRCPSVSAARSTHSSGKPDRLAFSALNTLAGVLAQAGGQRPQVLRRERLRLKRGILRWEPPAPGASARSAAPGRRPSRDRARLSRGPERESPLRKAPPGCASAASPALRASARCVAQCS